MRRKERLKLKKKNSFYDIIECHKIWLLLHIEIVNKISTSRRILEYFFSNFKDFLNIVFSWSSISEFFCLRAKSTNIYVSTMITNFLHFSDLKKLWVGGKVKSQVEPVQVCMLKNETNFCYNDLEGLRVSRTYRMYWEKSRKLLNKVIWIPACELLFWLLLLAYSLY